MLGLLLAIGLKPVAAESPRLIEGEIGGAEFQISLPAKWSGGLVLFAHGYQGEGAAPGAIWSSKLEMHLAEQGHAAAASGFRSMGYRPDWFLADMLALRERFIRDHGQPRWTIIHGQSMGGHIAVAGLELHPGLFQGALVECGVVDGVGLVDWLYAYTAATELWGWLAPTVGRLLLPLGQHALLAYTVHLPLIAAAWLVRAQFGPGWESVPGLDLSLQVAALGLVWVVASRPWRRPHVLPREITVTDSRIAVLRSS